MSLHMGALLVEGDHRNHLREIFETFEYADTGNDEVFRGAGALEKALERDWMVSRTRVRKPVFISQGWTVIVDNEMVMDNNEKACCAISSRFGVRVFGWLAEASSGSYGFNLYKQGRRVRGYLAVEGEIKEEIGTPSSLELKFRNRHVYSDENQIDELGVLAIMKDVTGVDFDLWDPVDITVKELDEGDAEGPPPAPPATHAPAGSPEPPQKSRWKFWK